MARLPVLVTGLLVDNTICFLNANVSLAVKQVYG